MDEWRPFEWQKAWALSGDLSDGAKAVLSVLFAHMNDGECWPSQSTIAEAVGRSERTVRSRIDEAKEAGFLETEKRSRPNAGGWTRLYRASFPISDRKEASTPDRKAASGAIDGPESSFRRDGGDRKEVSGPDRKAASGTRRTKNNEHNTSSPSLRSVEEERAAACADAQEPEIPDPDSTPGPDFVRKTFALWGFDLGGGRAQDEARWMALRRETDEPSEKLKRYVAWKLSDLAASPNDYSARGAWTAVRQDAGDIDATLERSPRQGSGEGGGSSGGRHTERSTVWDKVRAEMEE